MIENLVIVESPAKAKTIERFLGENYVVKSSFGHIRDLEKKDLGIDIEHNFQPKYEISPDKKAIVKEAAKYVGISTGIALGIFCFVGMIFDLYYGGNFSLSGYQFTKMVVGCVVVGWGFGVPAVVYRKENMPMPIRVVIHMGSGCVIYTLVACWAGWIDLSAGLWQGIGMIAAQLAAAFLIWFFFLLHYRREAKEMNERIQEMKKGKD